MKPDHPMPCCEPKPSKLQKKYLENTMTIKAVVWDIGGVLIRTEDPEPRGKLAAELGVTREYLVQLVFGGEPGTRAQTGELSQEEVWAYVRSELKLAPGEYPDLRQRFFGGDILDTELLAFIRAIKTHYKTGIISNAWSELAATLEEWDILEDFHVVVGSGDVGIMKPDPKIYQIALEQLSVEPGEAVFIDDFIENVEGARQLGIQAIHFRNRDQALSELKTLLGM
jgi:glucose-1-phosphatase